MKVIFHEDFHQVYSSDPAASAGRMQAIIEIIKGKVELIEPSPAQEEDIARVHTPAHVDWVKSSGVYQVAALAAGGAIEAAKIGLSEPCFGLIRPPGHHASASSAWGFCYFNNMAIALEYLKEKKRIRTAYVLDIDLHFGDGTVNILNNKDYVIVHNISSQNRDAYLAEVEDEMSRCGADIIGISAGFDNHEDDWGGTLKTDDYKYIGALVKETALRNNGGCFAILEGGYNHRVLGHNVMALLQGMEKGINGCKV